MMGRPSTRHIRRLELARAMMRAVSARGYSATTTAAIAEEADVSPGLVHYHFKSKDEVVEVLLELLTRTLRARYIKAAAVAHKSEGGAKREASAHLRALIWAFVGDAEASSRDPDAVAAWVALSAEALHDVAIQRAVRGLWEETARHMRGLLVQAARGIEGEAVLGPPASADERLAALDDAATAHPRVEAGAAALLALIQGAFQLDACAPDAAPRGFAGAASMMLAEQIIETLDVVCDEEA